MQASLCSRCGLLRLPSVANPYLYPGFFAMPTLATIPPKHLKPSTSLQYFHLHPHETAVCSTCTNVTCHCPYDIDIPAQLSRIHQQMSSLRERGLLPATPSQLQDRSHQRSLHRPDGQPSHPQNPPPWSGQPPVASTCITLGRKTWTPSNVVLAVVEAGKLRQQIRLRHDVEPGTRTHFTFELTA